MPTKEFLNFFLFILYVIGPQISLPCVFKRFFNKITLFSRNFIQEPSYLKNSFFTLIIIPLTFDFLRNQLFGLVRRTETFMKFPTYAVFLLKP